MKTRILLASDATHGGGNGAAPEPTPEPSTQGIRSSADVNVISQLRQQLAEAAQCNDTLSALLDERTGLLRRAGDEIAQLQLEKEELQGEIAQYQTANKDRSARELRIADKVGKGLTREQAIAVIERQDKHDKLEKEIAGKITEGRKTNPKYGRAEALAAIQLEAKAKA